MKTYLVAQELIQALGDRIWGRRGSKYSPGELQPVRAGEARR
jgi:hypothetical protein